MLDLEELYNRKDLENAITAHKKALSNRRLDEDRRLFYVALTRTERALFISAHHWAESGSEPKGPSEFLDELHQMVTAENDADEEDSRGAIGVVEEWAPAPEPDTENPLAATPRTGAVAAGSAGCAARRGRGRSRKRPVRTCFAAARQPRGGRTGGRSGELGFGRRRALGRARSPGKRACRSDSPGAAFGDAARRPQGRSG